MMTDGDFKVVFEQQVQRTWPAELWCGTHVLVAVSGGADSVALLRALVAARRALGDLGRLFVGHFDHGWRGEASRADADWVRHLAESLGVEFILGGGPRSEGGNSPTARSEDQARRHRYDFLRSASRAVGARYIAVGHTADDQSETVLHRILRGSGLDGLTGIPPTRVLDSGLSLVRPLLSVRRGEVIDYLKSLDQSFRRDASNDDRTYARNFLRHELLPLARRRFGAGVDDAILRLRSQAHEAQEVVHALAAELRDRAVSSNKEGGLEIDAPAAAEAAGIVVREACKLAWREAGWPEQSMGDRQWRELEAMVQGERSTAFDLPSGVRASLRNGVVRLERIQAP